MNAKLFKKLNEQVEINNLKNIELTESEKKEVETKVVFESFTQETEDLLRVEDDSLSLKEESIVYESLILDELAEYLSEELTELNEDTLNEGKLWDKIRWKLAKFSLGFLKENSINEFLMAYYKNSKEGKEWVAKSKKEKVRKIRDLAENLKPEEKEKVTNSEAAKKMERSAIKSGIFAGIAGISAGIAYNGSNKLDSKANTFNSDAEYAKNSASNIRGEDENGWMTVKTTKGTLHRVNKKYLDDRISGGYLEIPARTVVTPGGEKIMYGAELHAIDSQNLENLGNAKKFDNLGNSLSSAASILGMLSSLLFGAMWGSLIVAGVGAVRTGIQAHKANVMRREEILQQLMQSKKKE